MKPEELIATKEDLREILTQFWLQTMDNTGFDPVERMKASELLAKYILGEGKTSVKRRDNRPSTAELLKLVSEMEGDSADP